MNFKKIFLIVGMIFLITGCTANYELTYEDGVFSEHVVIKQEQTGDETMEFGIDNVKNNPSFFEIDENNSYDYEFGVEGNLDVLTMDFTYDKLSFENSRIYKGCFRYKTFIEEDDYYYLNLQGDVACEYLSNADIVFKTDKVVINSNADEKDEEKGIYKWNDFEGGEIILQVSKINDINSVKDVSNGELIPWYWKLIISVVLVVIIGFVYKKIKDRQAF